MVQHQNKEKLFLRTKWLLLSIILVSLWVNCTAQEPTHPTPPSCLSASQKLEHPEWKLFTRLASENKTGLSGCLQMAWKDDVFQESQTQLVRVKSNGELTLPDGIRSPFSTLQLPENAKTFAYRFRLFVFPSNSQSNQQNTCAKDMLSPTYECLTEQQRDTCWFQVEFRLNHEKFDGMSVLIDDKLDLFCKISFREPIPEHPSQETSDRDHPTEEPQGIDEPNKTDAGEYLPEEHTKEGPQVNERVHNTETTTTETPEGPPVEKEYCLSPGQKQDCYESYPGSHNMGLCQKGTKLCLSSKVWGPCTGQVIPTQELCNGKDDNCNGIIDDLSPKTCSLTPTPKPCNNGLAQCENGKLNCKVRNPQSTEDCENGIDDDCDGKIDNGSHCFWLKGAGGGGIDFSNHIISHSDGSVYVTGVIRSESIQFGTLLLKRIGVQDMFVAKLNTKGEWLWVKNTGSSAGVGIAQGLAISQQGELYLTGKFLRFIQFGKTTLKATTTTQQQLFVASINAKGEWQWAISVTGSTDVIGNDIKMGPNGDLYITGSISGSKRQDIVFGKHKLQAKFHIFVAKLTSKGEWIWVEGLEHMREYNINPRIAVNTKGEVFLAGNFSNSSAPLFGTTRLSAAGRGDIFVAKLDQKKQWVWHTSAGSKTNDWLYVLLLDPKGNPVVGGSIQEPTHFDSLYLTHPGGFMAALDQKGKWKWASSIGRKNFIGGVSYGVRSVHGIVYDTSGNMYISGLFSRKAYFGPFTLDAGNPGNAFYWGKLDAAHTWQWVYKAAQMNELKEKFHSMALSSDNSLLTTGNSIKPKIYKHSLSTKLSKSYIYIGKNIHR
mgnify:CR=1 FL=1